MKQRRCIYNFANKIMNLYMLSYRSLSNIGFHFENWLPGQQNLKLGVADKL
jgi:hypothetical protein